MNHKENIFKLIDEKFPFSALKGAHLKENLRKFLNQEISSDEVDDELKVIINEYKQTHNIC